MVKIKYILLVEYGSVECKMPLENLGSIKIGTVFLKLHLIIPKMSSFREKRQPIIHN